MTFEEWWIEKYGRTPQRGDQFTDADLLRRLVEFRTDMKAEEFPINQWGDAVWDALKGIPK